MVFKSLAGFVAAAAFFATPSLLADTVYRPGDAGWGEELTVGDGETAVIDGGNTRHVWNGAVKVASGGTLKTRGSLIVLGASALNAGGSLDVETGSAQLAFGGGSVAGKVTVRAGAELKLNASEVFKGAATTELHVYGTFNCQSTRQRLDNSSAIYFHDGSKIIGSGDGNGGLDFGATTDINRIVVDGTVTVDTPVKSRTGGTISVACHENAHVLFNGGFLYGGASNGKGNVAQVAATAAEGNVSEACANSKITFGQSDFTGKITLMSKAVFLISDRSCPYTVETTGDEVEFNMARTTAQGNLFIGVLPSVSTSTAVFRLTGEGLLELGTTAPDRPVVLDGATLCMAAGAPVALAPGSRVESATQIGVDGLAPDSETVIFTGADASFDVSKLSVVAMHRYVALTAPGAVSISGDNVTVAGVSRYNADSWVEPYLRRAALLWLDASDAANFVFKDGEAGTVDAWKDKSDSRRDATAYAVPSHDPNWGSFSVAAGVPAYLMGECNSGIDLRYPRMTTIRSVFWVMSIRQDLRAFWLGDTSAYRFHRGNGGAYCYNNANAYFREGKMYCDGVEVTGDKYTVKVPTDRHVYSAVTTKNCESDRLTCDRNCDDYGRHGGREISELIVLPHDLPDADRQAIEAYLAAKWMGTSPSAALQNTGVYTFGDEFTVDGAFNAAKDLVFAEGASVSILNPASEGAMLKTSGAVTFSAGSALPVAIDARRLSPGTYTVLEAAGGITSADQFSASATVFPGVAASFAVTEGRLTMTITASMSSSVQTWRPASSADLGWNATSANWMLDGGAASGFLSYVAAVFDGVETAAGPIEVTGEHTMGPLSVTGARDYVFTGDGVLLGSSPITFGGTGTITLDGPGIDEQDVVIEGGQKVALGANASEGTLGADSGSTGGKVTIRDGGQFNANSLNTAGNNTDARFEITQIKTFVIAGDGPDGRGAIVNDCLDGRTTHDSAWGPVLRRVELSGDATIGGTDRFDVRVREGTAATAVGGIYGPGKNLTIKNTGYFGLINLPIDVEGVLVTGGGVFRPEAMGEANFKIPGGITLDNGTLHGYGSTYPTNVAVNVEAGGGIIDAQSGTTTFKGPVNVKEGATLTLNGANVLTFNGAMNVAGTLRNTDSTRNLAGPFTGVGFENTGGDLYLANGFTSGDLDVSISSGHVFLKEGMKAGVITVNMTGGVPGFFPGSGTAPQFTELNINKVSGTPGLDIRPQATGMMDVSGKVNANFDGTGTIYVYGAARDGEYGMALNLSGSADTLIVGYDASHGGDLRLKAGSDLTAKKVYTGYNSSGTSHGRIVIDSGAKLTATSELFMGRYGGSPSTKAVQTMDVSGTLDAAGITFYSAYDTPRTETYIREGGVVKANGITMNRTLAPSKDSQMNNNSWAYGSGVAAAEGRHWLIMEGGRIEMGGGGLLGQRVPGVTKIDLQNGELVNVKAAWGGSQGFPVFFGYEKLGGSFTFDLDEYYVNWNQGLSGASDLTIKGSADFTGHRKEDRMQGVMLGKVTVENTAANDLRVTSAFSGGLKLAEGVNAEVAKYSDERYPYAVAGYVIDQMAETAWSYPFVSANFWNFTAKNYSSGSAPYSKHSTWAGRGEFYVPAEKAGTWTFAGQCDDWVRLDIDGTQVMRSGSKCAVARGSVELTEGWHKFTLALTDWEGGAGPSNAGWKDVMAVGFIVGESTSTTPGDYTKFAPGANLGDGLTLQVRPVHNVCVWSWQNGNGSWNTTENWNHIKCLDSVEYMHRHGNSGTDSTRYFNDKKVSRFQGWFKVEENQGGQWSFDMHYDDYKMLVIDGVTLINVGSWGDPTNAKVTLAPGWHRWEARVGDSTGGYGPNNDKNNYWTLSYVAPDSPTEKQFIETNLKLAATLGDIAVLEPTGIYKELMLGAGSTLTSSGTMAMPIFGTLKGTGSLAGAFAFAGDANCWEAAGTYNRRYLAAAKFADADRGTFIGLRAVKVVFDAAPRCAVYHLANAPAGLSATDLADVKVTASDAERDYSDKFGLGIRDGRIVLLNRASGGTVLFLR